MDELESGQLETGSLDQSPTPGSLDQSPTPGSLDQSFVRTQETANYQPNREETQWEAIRDECASGGAMDERCNIVSASLGTGKLNVVAKRLSCGCLLVPVGSDEIVL